MPQLNPHPWFEIMAMTWFIIMILILYKTSLFISPNNCISRSINYLTSNPWTWSW